MNQPRPIQSLLGGGSGKQQAHHLQQLAGSQQELQQQHHSLASQQHQPLVNASQQTILQFHQQTLQHQLHHPYSTLHLQQQQQQQHPYSTLHLHHQQHLYHAGHLNNTNTHRPAMHQTLPQHQLHHPSNSQASSQLQQHQLQQQHNNSQQQYNMNSDYSSSTYHIYDQISDLIIIKQQRMERKRQLEQRRKVILIALAATLLVSSVCFLAFQALLGGSPGPASGAQLPHLYSSAPPQIVDTSQLMSAWPATHLSAASRDAQLPYRDTVLLPTAADQLPCSGHGTVIHASDLTINSHLQCRCDAGYLGDRCQFPVALSGAPIAVQTTTTSTTSTTTSTAAAPTEPPNEAPTGSQLSSSTGAPSGAAYAHAYGLTVAQVNCMQLTDCSAHGFCNSLGRCQCQPGFVGDDCSIQLERQCDDGLDNDHDGLVDCADSECCSDRACQDSTLCMKSPDPLDILMRKQPLPPTSSFFQRMQFLIEKYSSQTYSSPRDFNDSISAVSRYLDRASVVRGRVTYMKQGVTGVRVSVAGQTNVGMTLTRDGGYFDLLVNGGGAVTIECRREPFATKQKIVRVPWNEIVLIDQIELKLESSADLPEQVSAEPQSPSCFAHNYKLMRPRIMTQPKSWRTSHRSSSSWSAHLQGRVATLRDSAMVQHDIIQLPSSAGGQDSFHGPQANQSGQVSLVYIPSRPNELMSTIFIQLTPPAGSGDLKLPQELRAIHLRIVIEGNLFEQLFEPQMNLTYTYAWNRRNVYRQKSFGLSTASVSVGYEYFDCKQVIWNTKHVQLPGHDLSISDIGTQWNLNIHHRYNYRDSILQRGDGRNFNLKTDKPWVVQQILGGNGQPRPTVCPHCDSGSGEQRLLKPQALVSAPDGSLYVADFNLIRRIEWSPATGASNRQQHSSPPVDPVIKTILELPSSRVPSKYSLALNPAGQRLYMSDIDRHQIYLIREQQQQPPDLNETTGSPLYPSEESLLPVVGDGVRCQLEDGSNCGDRQSARVARLVAPKAIAFDLSGRMYIADGPNVRMVDTDEKIYTILGDYRATRHTKFPCSGEAVPMHKFVPKSPQDLAFNPIDDTLFVLDDNVVYKVTQDKRVQVVAGKLAHCDTNSSPFDITKTTRKPRATEVQLLSAQSITFNQNGDLFISEDDQSQQISRVLLVNPEEDSISLFAGVPVDQLAGASRSGVSGPTVDSVHQLEQLESGLDNNFNDKQRASNSLPLKSQQTTRATDYKFSSVAAIAVDQQGRLLVADKLQLKIFSVEPDLPKMNAAGEFELQSPDNPDELLVFNRFGHHLATRDISRSGAQRGSNKYTFSYTVNTSFGLLGSVSYASGNKISIHREGPHHAVRIIETAYKGQCKLDISRAGQVPYLCTHNF